MAVISPGIISRTTDPATIELLAYEGVAHLAVRGRILCSLPVGITVSANVPKGTLICPHCRHLVFKMEYMVI